MAASAELSWPSVGKFVSAYEENLMAADTSARPPAHDPDPQSVLVAHRPRVPTSDEEELELEPSSSACSTASVVDSSRWTLRRNVCRSRSSSASAPLTSAASDRRDRARGRSRSRRTRPSSIGRNPGTQARHRVRAAATAHRRPTSHQHRTRCSRCAGARRGDRRRSPTSTKYRALAATPRPLHAVELVPGALTSTDTLRQVRTGCELDRAHSPMGAV